MCKSIRHTYYCEELFVVKHKSRHSCASAIFYDLGPEEVVQKCQFDYIYNTTMPPTVLDGGRSLLLANFHGPRSLKCNSKNGGLPKPAPEHVYAVVDRSFLCDCQLDLEHHATILRQLSSCTDNRTTHFRVEFVVNLGFSQLLQNRRPNLVENIHLNTKGQTQVFNVRLAPVDPDSLGGTHRSEKCSETHQTTWPLAPCISQPRCPPTPRINSTHGSCTIHCSDGPFSWLIYPHRTVSPSPFQIMDTGCRSHPCFCPQGCRCPPTTHHDRRMF